MSKRQEFVLKFRLPAGKKLAEDPELFEWLAGTIAVSRFQGIDCELTVDGEPIEIDVTYYPEGKGKPS